ncbi:MAG: TraR/DksA family transcriptional regulator [Actinobacteria bacterium]|nr:TraR/DksA family transcriptional regulator [Actinomycetota bacterium]
MPETTFSTQRAQLTEEREHLLTQLEHMGRAPGTHELEFDDGFADSGQVTAERGEVDALAGSLLENLRDVEAALAKMDGGTYGPCESCGEQIPDARLEAMPSARYCIACASARR